MDPCLPIIKLINKREKKQNKATDKPVLLRWGLSLAYHWLITGLSVAYLCLI